MSATTDVEKEVGKQTIEYLSKTPQAVAVLFCSFLSGQLWAFVVLAYCKKNARGNKLIQSVAGRTAIGFAWFTLVMVPIYLIYYGSIDFEHARILTLVVPTIVMGLFIQVIAFACFVRWGK